MARGITDRPVGRVAAVVLQVADFAALLVLVPHSNPTRLGAVLSVAPLVVLVPLAIPAIPATLLAVGLGAAIGAAGVPPESLPALLLTNGDVLFSASALAVAVAATWAGDRLASTR